MWRWVAMLSMLLACQPLAAETALIQTWQTSLKQAHIPLSDVAVWVQAVEGGAPLIAHNAEQAMRTASVMKLVTSYAALEALGPDYRWKTEVFHTGQIQKGVLEGDLILKGGADPAFTMPAFWQLLQQIHQQGIHHLHGDLWLDTSVFDPAVSQRPALDQAPWRAYNAPPSAMLLDGRQTSFRLSLTTDRPANTPARVEIQQVFPLPQIEVINQLKVVAGACVDWKSKLDYQVMPTAEGVRVTFNGVYPAQCENRNLALSLFNDSQYVAFAFRQLWQSLGGRWTGGLKLHAVPADAHPVTVWWSPPLGEVLPDINKWSNNVMARQLMLTLGLAAKMQPVDEAHAALAMQQALREQGLVFPELVLENGAGLSRIESISAAHLGALLQHAYQRPTMPILMASLPILGVDGTTQQRLSQRPSQGRAYLKTGSLEGVSSIAGYVQDQQNKRYVLVMLVNHANAAASRASQDALIEALIARGTRNSGDP